MTETSPRQNSKAIVVFKPSGKVVEVNNALEASPETVNKAPYTEGWIAVIEIKDESEKSSLMDNKKYKEYLKSLSG